MDTDKRTTWAKNAQDAAARQLRETQEAPTQLIPENQPTSLTEKFLWGVAGFFVVIGIAYAISHYIFGWPK